jgi:hypothetical protein
MILHKLGDHVHNPYNFLSEVPLSILLDTEEKVDEYNTGKMHESWLKELKVQIYDFS